MGMFSCSSRLSTAVPISARTRSLLISLIWSVFKLFSNFWWTWDFNSKAQSTERVSGVSLDRGSTTDDGRGGSGMSYEVVFICGS